MRRRPLLALLGVALLRLPRAAGQQRPAVLRIGLLMGAVPESEKPRLDAFRGALGKLGYRDGDNIVIEVRYAEGRTERFGALAHELVATAPAVIACVGGPETAALQAATPTIPIVFMQTPNPVELGLIKSLARPGGNTTGFIFMSAELDAKRLELLHELAPEMTRAAFLINPTRLPGIEQRFVAAQMAARRLEIALTRVVVTSAAELPEGFKTIEKAASQALLIQGDPLLSGTEAASILQFAAAHRQPTVFEQKLTVARGGLMSYGSDPVDSARLAAGYVAKILNGARPADLPVQQPTRFELVINLNTAKALGITLPQSLLARADQVIE